MSYRSKDQLKRDTYTALTEVWTLAKKWIAHEPKTPAEVETMSNEFNELCKRNRETKLIVEMASAMYGEIARNVDEWTSSE